MGTRSRIKHVYQGVQGACPQQAVTSAEGTAERQRVPCHRHGSKACTTYHTLITVYLIDYITKHGDQWIIECLPD